MHLSKSDFKVARTCGTKLYYKKLRYPSKQDDDPYLEFLADGGYMVETIAKLLFPEGNLITAPPDWVGENAPDAIVKGLLEALMETFAIKPVHNIGDRILFRHDNIPDTVELDPPIGNYAEECTAFEVVAVGWSYGGKVLLKPIARPVSA